MDLRRVLTGLFSVNKTGCQWRLRPTDVGHGPAIYGYCRRGRRAGVWERLMTTRRHWERQGQGRRPEPSAAWAEGQSLKPATPGTDVGFDGNKKVKGRQRHLVVETLGRIVAAVVPAAKTDDRQGLVERLQRYGAAGGTRLRNIWGDGGYDPQLYRSLVH